MAPGMAGASLGQKKKHDFSIVLFVFMFNKCLTNFRFFACFADSFPNFSIINISHIKTSMAHFCKAGFENQYAIRRYFILPISIIYGMIIWKKLLN